MTGTITKRDLGALRWIARWRHVSARQVHRWLGASEHNQPVMRTVYTRLARCTEAGLLVYHEPLLAGGAGVWAVTRDGLDAAGLHDWWAPTFSKTLVDHDLGVVDAALDAEARGLHVVSEREAKQDRRLRRHGDPGYSGWAVDLDWQRRHWPDYWAIANGDRPARRAAVELELTAKDTGRLEDILQAYRLAGEAGGCHEVVYLSQAPSILRAVREAATGMGLVVIDGDRDAGPAQADPPVVITQAWKARHRG